MLLHPGVVEPSLGLYPRAGEVTGLVYPGAQTYLSSRTFPLVGFVQRAGAGTVEWTARQIGRVSVLRKSQTAILHRRQVGTSEMRTTA